MLLGRNVLLFHTGALGDFILTWPIAVALARLHPQSRIFYVTHGAKGKLAEKAIGVDSVDIDVGWHPLHGDSQQLNAANRKSLGAAHTIVSFVSDGTDAWAKNVSSLAGQAKVLYLRTPPRGRIGDGVHVSDFFLQQLEAEAVLHTAVGQILRSVADRGIGGRLAADGRIVIHPGAGAAAKCWPVDSFVEVAKRLTAAGHKVEFVLGEAEMEKWPAAEIQKIFKVASVQKPADLVGLYQMIRGASCFIGNDSGPGHLAGIVGVPTVSIFGGGDADSWKPLGPAVRAVVSGGIDEVELAASELLRGMPLPR
jgi:ADP-heptose:LPS heptosyltransferase